MLSKLNFIPHPEWDLSKHALQVFANEIVHIQESLLPAQPSHAHRALDLHPEGIQSKALPYPQKKLESIQINLNLANHKIITTNSIGSRQEFYLASIKSSHHLNQIIQRAVQSFNLPIQLAPPSTSQAIPTTYLPHTVTPFFQNISSLRRFVQRWKNTTAMPFNHFQFWPKRLQTSIETFGTRTVYFKNDQGTFESPAQISFGFSVANAVVRQPYVFANPWPFQNEITHRPLPAYARWYTESWQGSLLPLTELTNSTAVQDKLTHFFNAVVQAAHPYLSE